MTASSAIYMDNHATTRVDPRVVEAMLPYFNEFYGNPGSRSHSFGDAAHEAVDRSQQTIATSLGAEDSEILFTSGATESNNLAIRGVVERYARKGRHLVSVRTEHRSVLDPLERLSKRDCELTLLDVEQHGSARAGLLDPQRLADALRDDTVLASVMLANNEIGVIQPIRELAGICHERDVLFHCDATQAVGKIPVNVQDLGVDLMSFTAHKIYGPKGVGGLYVRSRNPIVRISPQITGGGQQSNRRSGTLNVPGIIGLAMALELCLAELETEQQRLAALRNRLFSGIRERVKNSELNGPGLEEDIAVGPPTRLPGNLNVAFHHVDGEAVLLEMQQLAVSSGATCASNEPGPSHVLLALGLGEDLARGSLRFGLGRFNTAEEVEQAVELVVSAVQKLEKLSSA